jgi:radical SAM superfamily enzyme YgiQ (UPF0313 family)
VGKPSNRVETYIERIKTLHDHQVGIIGCFIFGLDHDTPDVFEKSYPFIQSQIEVPQLSLLTPFPGTALHRRMKREGRLLHEDWSEYDITHPVFRPRNMSVEELEQGFSWLCRRIHSFPAMVERALRFAGRRARVPHPRLGFTSRFSSVLAPNLIYRSLARIGRPRRPAGARPWWYQLPASV